MRARKYAINAGIAGVIAASLVGCRDGGGFSVPPESPLLTGGQEGEEQGGEIESALDTAGLDTADTALEECDTVSPVVLYLSPDDSNSMSSPVQAREAALDGWSDLSMVSIRPWEFMNYYDVGYAPAQAGEIAVVHEMVQDPDSGEYALQIGVSSPEIGPDERAPMNLTFVLDTSGSMSGAPLTALKATARQIAGNLQEGDTASMVLWSDSTALVLDSHAITGPDDPTLLARIEGLSAGGSTDLHGGLTRGYEVASKNYSAQHTNRVILISDGGANAGVTEIDIIAKHAGDSGEDGIYLVGVGVGSATSYHDGLMDQVTDAGKGASVFVPGADEAERIFGDRFLSTLGVAARDVGVRLELPPGFEIVLFSGEEISTDHSEIEPQHLAPNDAMVFHQTLESCDPETVDLNDAVTVSARYTDATSFEQGEISATATLGELLAEESPRLRKGAAIHGYAVALQAWQAGESSAELDNAFYKLSAAEALLPGDPELAEIREVLEVVRDRW